MCPDLVLPDLTTTMNLMIGQVGQMWAGLA